MKKTVLGLYLQPEWKMLREDRAIWRSLELRQGLLPREMPSESGKWALWGIQGSWNNNYHPWTLQTGCWAGDETLGNRILFCLKHLTKTLSSSGGIPGIPLLQDSSPSLGSSRLPERLRVLHWGGSQGVPFPGPSGATGAPRGTPCLSEGETVNYPAQAAVPSLQTAQQLLTERARGACRRHPRSSWEMQHCHISSSLYYVLVRFFSPSALPKPP